LSHCSLRGLRPFEDDRGEPHRVDRFVVALEQDIGLFDELKDGGSDEESAWVA